MAKVQKDGRLILYYLRGKPVYADETSADVETGGFVDKGDIKGHPDNYHHMQNDDDKDTRNTQGSRDDPKDKTDKTKKGAQVARYKFVRGKDGKLNVQYIDVNSGKVINTKDLAKYKISSGMSTLDSVNELNTGFTKPNEKKTEDTKTDDTKTEVVDHSWDQKDGDFNDHAANGRASNTSSSKTSNTSSPSNKGVATGSDNNTEQGDLNSPDNSGIASMKDTATQTEENNNNYSVKDYTPDQVKDVAKTLAGEIDSRYTDTSTEDGQKEVNGIVSTMQNRDDVTPGDISAAIHAPNAYSTWNNEKLAANAEANYAKDPAKWDSLAKGVLSDPSKRMGFTNYFNPSIVNPSWSKNLLGTQKIGPHMFGIDPSIANKPKTDVATDPAAQAPTGLLSVPDAYSQMANTLGPAGLTDLSGTTQVDETGSVKGQLNKEVGHWQDEAQADKALSDYNASVPSMDTASGAQSNLDKALGVSPDVTNTNSMAEGLAAQRDYTSAPSAPATNDFDYGRFGAYDTPDTSNFDSGRFGAPNTNNFDSGRFGPSISQSPTGVYGDPTGGFGSYVDTDTNAAANSGDVAAANAGKINDSVTGTAAQPGGQLSNDITSSAPSISADTSNNSVPDTSNFDSGRFGDPASTDTGTDTGTTDATHDTNTSAPGVGDTTSSSSTSTSTSTSTSATGGIFGGIGGLFGGDAGTDTGADTDSGTTGGTPGGGGTFGGGFADGY